ncbi:hypothetical protein [Anaerohalosphaera lusitana]|uniref:hypothetical protein n=1 Tax=Anaerohalosphaera lusitana TaxID=1936003 RepID=UPI0011BAA2E9|nr:hypothetical protein [Anaerohalosphaera lusitana]
MIDTGLGFGIFWHEVLWSRCVLFSFLVFSFGVWVVLGGAAVCGFGYLALWQLAVWVEFNNGLSRKGGRGISCGGDNDNYYQYAFLLARL